MIGTRFEVACRRLGLNAGPMVELDTTQFVRAPQGPQQGDLFG
jgi:hypothetical protein